jgi:glyoxylase-like metal-dependent hydrolase (beta-lactamase superfamily II)
MKADEHRDIGGVRFLRVKELTRVRPPEVFFGEHATQVVDTIRRHERWLGQYVEVVDGGPHLLLTFQAFVLESGGNKILVDPCLGNGKDRVLVGALQTTFLEDLDEAVGGIDTIDLVVCTHLHFDHVGWCTTLRDGRWTPTFPQARHIVVGHEWEHWNFETAKDPDTDFARAVEDSVRPVVSAGLVDFVESDHQITSEIRLRPTAGHSPGHVSIDISSAGERAVISGDALHHPIQVVQPGLGNRFDADQPQAIDVRRALNEELIDSETLLIGTHFAGQVAGYVRRDGDATVFVPPGRAGVSADR